MATDFSALPFHRRSFRPQRTAMLRQRWLEGPAVVVTGMAGVGKTWTCQCAAQMLVAEGTVAHAWVVHVHGEPSSWGPAIAKQLAENAPETPEELAAWLDRRGPCLLALDLAVAPPEAVSWVELLAERAPSSRIALVSRRAFPSWSVPHVDVPPLSPPPGDELEGPAAAYLKQRLAQLGLEATDPAALAAIVRWVQGVPLAIDMVVPRLRVMTAPMLLHRLQKARSKLSTGGTSFDEVLELSWRVLDAPEREALVQLSVASAPVSLATAEALLGSDADDRLERLVNDGWLRTGEEGLTLLRAAAEVVRRRADDDALASAETAMVRALSGRKDPEARRQRSHALSLAAQRPRLARAQAEAVLFAMRRDAGPWFNDGLAPKRATHRKVVDAILEASQGSGAVPTAWVEAWLCRAEHAIVGGDVVNAETALSHAEGVVASLNAPSLVVAVGVARAELALAVHDGDRARDLASALRPQATTAGDANGELRCLAVLARAHEQLDDDRTALALWERLYSHVREHPTWREAAALRLAWCQLDLADHAAAARTLDEVETSAPHRVLRAFLAHDEGDLATAAEGYRALLPAASGLIEAMAWIGWGLLKRTEGEDAEAGSAFRQARMASSDSQSFDWARLAIALAHRADATLPEAARAPLLELPGGICGSRADRLATELRDGRDGKGVLARLAAKPATSTASPPAHALVLGPRGRWFRPPGGVSVSLVNRPTVARVLSALAAHRGSSPGGAMSYEAVLRAAWSGEKVRADAGAHRVRVAISTLRKLGLREQLQTVSGGYRLDPTCPVVTTPE